LNGGNSFRNFVQRGRSSELHLDPPFTISRLPATIFILERRLVMSNSFDNQHHFYLPGVAQTAYSPGIVPWLFDKSDKEVLSEKVAEVSFSVG
jgi:hypothetical protein